MFLTIITIFGLIIFILNRYSKNTDNININLRYRLINNGFLYNDKFPKPHQYKNDGLSYYDNKLNARIYVNSYKDGFKKIYRCIGILYYASNRPLLYIKCVPNNFTDIQAIMFNDKGDITSEKNISNNQFIMYEMLNKLDKLLHTHICNNLSKNDDVLFIADIPWLIV